MVTLVLFKNHADQPLNLSF
ncbi:MAG: hypothetical protein V6013_02020 [Candidatus Dasytiphilus stammeri]